MPVESLSALEMLELGVLAMIAFTFAEFIYLAFISKKCAFRRSFLQPLKSMAVYIVGSVLLGRLAPFIAVAAMAAAGNELAPAMLPDAWYGWPLALVVYEFWYWVQHYLAHKVRLLWCIHSAHHAPDSMNMLIGASHNVLESLLYFPFFFGFLTGLCGVPLEVVVVINLIDVIWGSLLHISPDLIKRRYGPLEYFLQTPSWHRVHHARNVRYMDTNFNSITLFWDWAMRTLEPLRDEEPVDYGITRPVRMDSYWDIHFGEFAALWRDIRKAPGLGNKLGYALMPPGWSHTGRHATVARQKQALRGAPSGEASV